MKKILKKIKNKLWRSSGSDIDFNTMMQMLKSSNRITIIDVRTKDEFEGGHIQGAVNIPLQDLKEKIELVVLDKSEVIIVYCQSGGRSRKAADKLEKMGYRNVWNLKNGLDG